MEGLPDELHAAILSQLSAHDILHCAAASRRLCRIATDNSLWQEVWFRRDLSSKFRTSSLQTNYRQLYRWRYSRLHNIPRSKTGCNDLVWDVALDEERGLVFAISEEGLSFWKLEDDDETNGLRLRCVNRVNSVESNGSYIEAPRSGNRGTTSMTRCGSDGRELLCSWGGYIYIKDMESGKTISTFSTETNAVPSMNVKENLIFAGCERATVKVFDRRSKPATCIASWREEGTVLGLEYLPSHALVTGGRFPRLSITDLRMPSKLLKALHTGMNASSLTGSHPFSPYTIHVGGHRRRGILDTWDCRPGHEAHSHRQHTVHRTFPSAITSSAGDSVVSCDWDGVIALHYYEQSSTSIDVPIPIMMRHVKVNGAGFSSARLGLTRGIIVVGSTEGMVAYQLGKVVPEACA
ncbi:hypothetical protein SpCBS45565_g01602 [Spizellomyces sp. 'palustris']|nr:hypothetical protein SpCBS45565_g01602 [Spizellomyces sp. 'palustris']